jgi:hypothetical protein
MRASGAATAASAWAASVASSSARSSSAGAESAACSRVDCQTVRRPASSAASSDSAPVARAISPRSRVISRSNSFQCRSSVSSRATGSVSSVAPPERSASRCTPA